MAGNRFNYSRPHVMLSFTDHWPCRSWTFKTLADLLENKTFSCRVIPKSCDRKMETQCSHQDVTIKEFCDWLDGTANDSSPLRGVPREENSCYIDYKYMKDVFEEHPDMFNEVQWKDFGLVGFNGYDSTIWLSSEGANTPGHQDTYGFNLITQIYGRKLWILFPPEDSSFLYPTRVPYEESSIFTEVNIRKPDLHSHPQFKLSHPYVVTLHPGQTLYVPRHWWHYVESLEPSISVNVWVPLREDKDSRFSEAITRCLATSLISSLDTSYSGCLQSEWLNPTETLAPTTMNLLLLKTSLCQLLENSDDGGGYVLDTDEQQDVNEDSLCKNELTQKSDLSHGLIHGENSQELKKQEDLSCGAIQQGYCCSQAVIQGDLSPGLVPQDDLSPGLVPQDDLLPGLVQQDDLLPGLVQQDDLLPLLVQQDDLLPVLVQQDDLSPGLLQQDDLLPVLVQQDDLLPGLVQQDDLLPVLVQQDDLLPVLVQQDDLLPVLVQQDDLLPVLVQQDDLLPGLVQQDDLLPGLVQKDDLLQKLVQPDDLLPGLVQPDNLQYRLIHLSGSLKDPESQPLDDSEPLYHGNDECDDIRTGQNVQNDAHTNTGSVLTSIDPAGQSESLSDESMLSLFIEKMKAYRISRADSPFQCEFKVSLPLKEQFGLQGSSPKKVKISPTSTEASSNLKGNLSTKSSHSRIVFLLSPCLFDTYLKFLNNLCRQNQCRRCCTESRTENNITSSSADRNSFSAHIKATSSNVFQHKSSGTYTASFETANVSSNSFLKDVHSAVSDSRKRKTSFDFKDEECSGSSGDGSGMEDNCEGDKVNVGLGSLVAGDCSRMSQLEVAETLLSCTLHPCVVKLISQLFRDKCQRSVNDSL